VQGDKVLRFGVNALQLDQREEAKRLRQADLVIAIQTDEQRQLQRMVPDRQIITAGVDFDVTADPGVPVGRQVLYVASANPINRKGVADFLRFAWGTIRREIPDAELVLAGDICDAVPIDVAGVRRLGRVADLAAVYRAARVVINPAVAGTGLKVKTLEALGHFRPIVSWPSGTEGMALELASLCDVVDDWHQFTRRVSALLAASEPRQFSRDEREAIARLTAPEHVYVTLTSTLDTLIATRFGAAASPA
jgi:glycosyltransferase involved in cell wall biosynthesis